MVEATTLLRFLHHGYAGRPSMDEPMFSERNSFGPAKAFMRVLFVVATAGLGLWAYSTVSGKGVSEIVSSILSYF
jgi:hypothetical protein